MLVEREHGQEKQPLIRIPKPRALNRQQKRPKPPKSLNRRSSLALFLGLEASWLRRTGSLLMSLARLRVGTAPGACAWDFHRGLKGGSYNNGLYRGYIGIMEKKMEATIMGYMGVKKGDMWTMWDMVNISTFQ